MTHPIVSTALTYGAVAGLTLTLGPAASLVSLVAEPTRADPLIRAWARGILTAAQVKVDVQGLERVPQQGQFILVANHQSHFDPVVIIGLIQRHLRFVAKAELYRIPLFGAAMRMTGNLKVDRKGSEHDRQVMQEAAQAVRERVSIVFFAEGTRTDDGVLRPFKKGAAALAIAAQVPVLPLALAGTKDILPKRGSMVRGGQRVAMRVGEPLPTEGMTPFERDALTQRAHDAVAKLLAEAERAI